jgi:hypothetical protein
MARGADGASHPARGPPVQRRMLARGTMAQLPRGPPLFAPRTAPARRPPAARRGSGAGVPVTNEIGAKTTSDV